MSEVMIYYISKESINSIFEIGKPKGFTSKFWNELSKILEGLDGIELSLGGGLIKVKHGPHGEEIKETVRDVDLALVRELITGSEISDVKEITKSDNPYSLYRFDLPLKVSETFNRKGTGTSIEVSHDSENLHFSGSTSSEKWIESLLSTIFKSNPFNASGIFKPITVTRENNVVKLSVKYLIIYK